MNGHRQAAVALYGLAPVDQDYILAGLPPHDQAILQDYLAELAALGFDKAANMADAAAFIPVPAPNASPAHATAPLTAHARLHGAAPDDVMSVIGNEPPALIAQLLAVDTWPWAAAVLDALPPHARLLVRDARAAGVADAPARTRFLLAAVDTRLRAVFSAPAPEPALPPAIGLFFAARKWLPWTR